MFNEISLLFTGMTASALGNVALAFFVIGIVLIFIEEFMPGFGVFGILGLISSVVAIVLRALVGDAYNVVAQIFIMLFFQIAFAAVGFLVIVILSKTGLVNRSWMVQNATAVSTEYSHGTANYTYLIGMQGVAATDLKPVGKGEFGGKIYDVDSGGPFITKGEYIRVESIEGVKITVVRLAPQAEYPYLV